MKVSRIETRWEFKVHGQAFQGTKTEFLSRRTGEISAVVYNFTSGGDTNLTFGERHLAPLQAFLSAMDSHSGQMVFRCQHCETELHYNIIDEHRWLDESNGTTCEKNPRQAGDIEVHETFVTSPGVHEPLTLAVLHSPSQWAKGQS